MGVFNILQLCNLTLSDWALLAEAIGQKNEVPDLEMKLISK
jgi:hypothetical protein